MDEEEIFGVSLEEEEIEDEVVTYRTYRMDLKHKRIIGKVDGIEAAAQSMFKALQTRRFAYLIYDDQYGCDVYNKIGNLDLSQSYIENDIPVMIEDAFLNDDMILGIDNLTFDMQDIDSVFVSFEAATVFGDADFEGVISDG